MSDSINLQSIGALLQIEQDVRTATSEGAVEFIAANDTFRILPYRQAVLWRPDSAGKPDLRLVSGLADAPADSPYRQWMNQALRQLVPMLDGAKALQVSRDMLDSALHAGWDEWMGGSVLMVALPTPAGGAVGGLWLVLEAPADEAQTALAERLAIVYGQGLWAWRERPAT